MTDLEIIEPIAKKLNVKLGKLDSIKWNSLGYRSSDDGSLFSLSLAECKIKKLDKISNILIELRNLKVLNLNDNNLIDISALKELKNLM
jgi:hypothetical protein